MSKTKAKTASETSKAKTASVSTNKTSYKLQRLSREALFISLSAFAVVLFLCLLGFDGNDSGLLFQTSADDAVIHNFMGVVGVYIADFFLLCFGYVAYVLPFLAVYLGWLIAYGKLTAEQTLDYRFLLIKFSGLLVFFLSSCGLMSMHFAVDVANFPSGEDQSAGGVFGLLVANYSLMPLFNIIGTTIILLVAWCISLSFFANFSWLALIDKTGALALKIYAFSRVKYQKYKHARLAKQQLASAKVEREQNFAKILAKKAERESSKRIEVEPSLVEPPRLSMREIKEQQIPLFKNDASLLPELSLLDPPRVQAFGYSEAALESLSQLLESKLADFGVKAEVVHIQPGPIITRFEIAPEAGTKASKITGLARDLARSMSVISVRVVEVISGKSTIGIEIPNEKREIISFGEIVKSPSFEDSKSALTIGLGKNIGGKAVSADLAKMPHLLVAGTTGSGKSVAINAMLLSLLYKATPREVRLILIDPKMLELNVYEGIGHLLCPVVTDPKEATNALRWCVGEMERRYKLMSKLGVRNIAGFNKKLREGIAAGTPVLDPLYDPQKAFDPTVSAPELIELPFIVVVVDEFADLMMMTNGKKVEEFIARLAQKARAAGIHLILATQRPSVDVVTGLIKANVPTRIAFQVSSTIDSRTILGQMGAEQLLGHGDMLYYQPGITPVPERVHGAFVEDAEVHRVVGFLRSLGAPEYLEEVLQENQAPIEGIKGEGGEGEADGYDELYDKAVFIVTQSRKASISNLQRRLNIGFNRAANLMDMMEEHGLVSAAEDGGKRQVLAPPPPEL